MNTQTITISSESAKDILTNLINEYIRIENSLSGLAYQQKSHFTRGKIAVIIACIGERWNFNETGQNYHDFLKYIVKKYELTVLWRINDL